ncbi:MAG: hypothetical protein AAF196_16035 [Planctomycetota bacterium]
MSFALLAVVLPARVVAQNSDDFNACDLDTGVWTVVDPMADGEVSLIGTGTGDAKLRMSIPGGSNHDAWGTNGALRAVQSVADADFTIEAKFDSAGSFQFQDQGLLIEQGPMDFIRFDVFSDGQVSQLFAASSTAGNPVAWNMSTLPIEFPVVLRAERVGDLFTLSYGAPGGAMTPFVVQSHTLTVTAVGPYVGNFNSNPAAAAAFTAEVDYFSSISDPLTGEDVGAPGPATTLTVDQVGSGSVQANPAQTTFFCDESVELFATAATGWNFDRWTGDVDTTDNPISVDMSQDVSVTAVYTQDTTPLDITNVQIIPDVRSATITWQTNDLATTSVSYGLTPSLELGTVGSQLLTTIHRVDLTDLQPLTTYFFELSSVEPSGDSTTIANLDFTTTDLPDAGIATDTFNDCGLNTVWAFQDPIGDCGFDVTGVGTEDARIEINVPSGAVHDFWPTAGFSAPRLMQTANNTDFTIEAKFDSLPAGTHAMQGILIVEGPGDALRFDFYSAGGTTNFFAATFSAENPAIQSNIVVPSSQPLFLRVQRQGDLFTVFYSEDGANWLIGAMFMHQIDVHEVGVFAGNAGAAPEFTAQIDYFLNLDDPFMVEDGPLGLPGTTLNVTPPVGGTIVIEPDLPLYFCGDVVEVRAVPDPGFSLSNWGGDLDGLFGTTETLVMDVSRTLTPIFVSDTFGPQLTLIDSLPGDDAILINWESDEPSTWVVDYGATPAFEIGSNQSGPIFETEHSTLLTGLMPDTNYFVRITAQDEFGNSSSTDYQLMSGPAGSSPAPRIDVWYGDVQEFFGNGVPQPWVNILGNVSGGGGVTSVSYKLNSNGAVQLNLGPDLRRLLSPGDFNIDIRTDALLEGSNTLVIEAVGESGLITTRTVTIQNLDKGSRPPAFASVKFANAPSLTDLVQPIDGQFEITPLGLHTVDVGYDRFVALGDIGWRDYEMTARLRLHGFDFPSSQTQQSGFFAAFGLMPRWPGHTENGQQPHWQPFPLGSIGWYRFNSETQGRFEIYGNDGFILDTDASFAPTLETDFYFKMRVETVGTSDVIHFKAWPAGTQEPVEWLLRGVQDGATDSEMGSAALLAHHCDVTFQTLDVVPGPFLDGTPPEASTFRYLASDTVADLSWSTNFESRTVVSYGLTSDFELGRVILEPRTLEHAVTLDGLTPSTDYMVRVSAEGNGRRIDYDFEFSTAAPGGTTSSLDSDLFSDDFSAGSLDTRWVVQDPVGDGTVSLGDDGTDAFLEMSVPAGVDHDVWIGGNNGLRLMQPLADTNFSVVGKWLTVPDTAFQFQGVMVLGDSGDLIRYDLLYTNSGPRLFAAIINGSGADVRLNEPIDPTRATHLRLSRVGDSWILSNSADGENWEVAGTFNHAMTVTEVGPYIGAAPGGDAPAFSSRLDYFFNEVTPISDEN